MTRLLTKPQTSPPRAHLLRMVRELGPDAFIRFKSSKFELVRVGKRLRPYGESLALAMRDAGVRP